MNLNNNSYNINLSGFSHTNNINNYFNNFNIKIYNQKDYYSDIYNSDFIKLLILMLYLIVINFFLHQIKIL